MNDLYRRFTGYDEITDLLAGSDEDALVVLNGKPALIRLPGEDPTRPARFVSTLLHGNEDSGFRAVLELLRRKDRYPFDLWVFLGNTRAARQEGWFAHRYLDDQEDFNRVWGLGPATTRMRRCAEEVLAEVTAGPLEAAVDLHNNTGENPPYAITAVRTPESLRLVGVCADIGLLWNLRINALMEALAPFCPAVAVECGKSGRPASQAFALGALDRFLETADIGDPALPAGPGALFEILHRVTVRSEVTVAFGGAVSDEVDLVLHPGLDSANFGMLLAGTELGRVHPGAAMPLCSLDMEGRDTTGRFFAVSPDGALVVTQDVTPAMMTTTALQARRDCLTYLTRRRA